METNELKLLHEELLKMVQEVHKICVDYNIKYTMLAGTMLGAIRHKGFIPWDDDIDLGMTWDNYNKFIKIMSELNHPWLELEFPLDKNYCYFLKVYDKNTTFIQSQRQEKSRGVFIDVFPIVHSGDTIKEVNRRISKCSFYKAMLLRKMYKIEESSLREIILSFVARFYTKKYVYKRIMELYEESNKTKSVFSSILFSRLKDTMPTELYESVQLYDFENIRLYGVNDYHKYLSDQFGDYMRMPPKELQIPHHFYFLDTKLPWREYRTKIQK